MGLVVMRQFLLTERVARLVVVAAMAVRHDSGENAMATFSKGDKVSWNSSQGKVEGKVVRKATSPTTIKGHKVAASKDNPEYIVESAKTGAKAAHKPEGLRKI